MPYNATVYHTNADGEPYGTFVCEAMVINGRIQMLRSNWIQCTGYEGKTLKADIPEMNAVAGDAAYDTYVRNTHKGQGFKIVIDNCQGFKDVMKGWG